MKYLALAALTCASLASAQTESKPVAPAEPLGLRLAPALGAPELKSKDGKLEPSLDPKVVVRELGSAHPTLSDPNLGVRVRKPVPLGPIAAMPEQKRIEVSVGMFHILRSYATIRVVAIGDPNLADIQVLSSKAALINGKKAGLTQVVIWDQTGTARQHELVVTGYPTSLIDEIRQALSAPEIKVRVVRDSVVLEGETKTAEAKTRAGQIAALFAERVINLLTVKEEPMTNLAAIKTREVLSQVKSVLPSGITAEALGEKIVLRGTVDTEDQRTRAEGVAKQFSSELVNLIELRPYTEAELRSAIGLPKITITFVRDQVLLDGNVENADQAAAAASIASKSGKTIINRLIVPKPPPIVQPAPPPTIIEEIQAAIREGNPKTQIKVRGTPTNLVLEGAAMDLAEADRAFRLAKSYAGQSASVDTTLLMLNSVQMVNLEMSILEINRDRAKQQGVTIPPLGTGQIGQALPFVFGEVGGVVGSPITRQTPLTFNVTALATKGIARILSQPNLSVMSGRPAKFQVGGQIPIPVISTTGTGTQQQSVEYRDYGITVDIVPLLQANGVISIDLQTLITSIDNANAAQIGNTVVPAFFSRQATSVLEVQDGGSLGIGGLIDRRQSLAIRGVPLLKDLPVIGKLFTSRQFQNNESELVIFFKVKTTGQALPRPYMQPTAATVSRQTSGPGGSAAGGG